MFNIVDYPPGLGECSFCKKHTCGTKEDGTQIWLHSPIELHIGNDLTIGYQCAKMIMDGFGLTVEVRERQVLMTPTDEQIGDFVRKAIITHKDIETGGMMQRVTSYTIPIEEQTTEYVNLGSGKVITKDEFIEKIKNMDRTELKNHLSKKEVPFIPQWGDERLREEALKHV